MPVMPLSSNKQPCAVWWLHLRLKQTANHWGGESSKLKCPLRRQSQKRVEPLNVNYLRAFCARQVPRRPLSGFPSSERGTAGPVRCPAVPTTPPDRRPPYRWRSDCYLCPLGTSAEGKGGVLTPKELYAPRPLHTSYLPLFPVWWYW